MIKINLCTIVPTGDFIELNFNSDNLASRFEKVVLSTYITYGNKTKEIDLSYLLEKIDNKESFLIPIKDLGFSNTINLFYIELTTNNKETATCVTANFTDIVVNNLDNISKVSNDKKSCLKDSNCGKSVEDILYTEFTLEQIKVTLQTKQFKLANSQYFSLKDTLIIPCEVFYPEFTLYTVDDEIRYTFDYIVSQGEPTPTPDPDEILTIPPRGENIFNR